MLKETGDALQVPAIRSRVRDELQKAVGATFDLTDDAGQTTMPLRLRHKSSGLAFRFIPAGRLFMGYSDREEAAARRIRDPLPRILAGNLGVIRPVVELSMDAFLMSFVPVTARLLRKYVGPQLEGGQWPDGPAFVPFDMAAAFAKSMGCFLPSEAEWEYACRAGTRTLFVWGDSLPSESDLAKWMICDFPDRAEQHFRCNAFGLAGLFCGEWCKDEFRPNHESRVGRAGEHVVRGGAAMWWPWQDEEWIWAMSAVRMAEGDLNLSIRDVKLSERPTAAFRLVFHLTDVPGAREV
ncbi:MAG TPA: SUMF1/EgtB/PvdO family nonheme iron enzyme [Gemmataceae bacterium]|nr:SUMF1/EgtB/PvdO family nonheme iron enzyme [Gemmataceae bacterium]